MKLLIGTLGVLALVLGACFALEAMLLGPFATPQRIAEYHFGSEAMVGHGGTAYLSRDYYVAFVGAAAALFLVSAALALRFVRRGGAIFAATSGLSALGATLCCVV